MLALEGIRIIDLSRLLPGPSGTMLLADMGADVIKVEETEDRAGVGRDVFTPPGMSPEREDEHAAYNPLGRNKKSIALNLKSAEGKEVFYRLARTADALLEGYRPGVVKRLGIDYDTLAKINPRLVYCSLSGYGQDGPYHDLPGHDPNYQGMAGLLSLPHDKDGTPVWTGLPTVDMASGLFVVIGILSALEARHKTGRGQHVDISMLDTAMHFVAMFMTAHLRTGRTFPRPQDNLIILETRDHKYLVLMPSEKHFWENFCKGIGRPGFAPLTLRPADVALRRRMYAEIREIIKTRTRDEWFELLRKADTCASPLLEIDEVPDNPQIRHRKLVQEIEHPRQGKVRQIGFPVKLSDTPASFRSFAPRLGEHSAALLTELGYSADEIQALVTNGVVKMEPPLGQAKGNARKEEPR